MEAELTRVAILTEGNGYELEKRVNELLEFYYNRNYLIKDIKYTRVVNNHCVHSHSAMIIYTIPGGKE
jgi:hypothetical protein